MSNVFHGWKRKAGILTLIAAMALTAAWIRSLSYLDEIRILATRNVDHAIFSSPNNLAWVWKKMNAITVDPGSKEPELHSVLYRPGYWGMHIPSRNKRVYWTSTPIILNTHEDPEAVDTPTAFDFNEAFPKARWYLNGCGFRFGRQLTNSHGAIVLNVPYWLLVCPMTLLSTLLLLDNRVLWRHQNAILADFAGNSSSTVAK